VNIQGPLYRIITLVLGTLMMSFAWPLRGQFGHEWGAAVTGAMAAAIAALLIPSFVFRKSFGQAVLFGTLGFVLGSENIPYGALIDGVLQQPSLKDCITEMLTILFIGASWGCVGATYLGLGLSEKPVQRRDYILLSAAGIALIALTFFLNSTGQVMLIFTVLILFLQGYNLLRIGSRTMALLGASGLVFFGLGFEGSVMILFWGNKGYLPGPEGWWTLRDQIWGGAGGLGIILAVWACANRHRQPVILSSTAFQRICYEVFIPVICGLNTWNVYEKWFKSSPVVSDPAAAAVMILAGSILLIGFFVFYLKVAPGIFSTDGVLNRMLLTGFLFFSAYLAFFAIAKSIVYSGWGAWETGFSLFLVNLLIFFLSMPFILLGPEDSSS